MIPALATNAVREAELAEDKNDHDGSYDPGGRVVEHGAQRSCPLDSAQSFDRACRELPGVIDVVSLFDSRDNLIHYSLDNTANNDSAD